MSRRVALALVWTLPSLVLVAITAGVYLHVRLDVPPRLDEAARTEVMRLFRAALDGGTAAAIAPGAGVAQPLSGGGPVVATVWIDGQRVVRAEGYGGTVGEAAAFAARAMAGQVASLAAESRTRARIKVDVVVARGPLGGSRWLFRWFGVDGIGELVPIDPGLDGIGVTVATPARTDGSGSGNGSGSGDSNGDGTREHLLLPDELVDHDVLATHRPAGLLPDWGVGLDRARVDDLLADRAGVGHGAWPSTPHERWRFRTDSFVERPVDAAGAREPGAPLALDRGIPPAPPLTAAALRAAATLGGRYLVAHMSPSGRYIYQRNLVTGRGTDPGVPGPYSIPRHAGTTYFLAELYRHTHDPLLREPIERAFGHLQELIDRGGCTGTAPGGEAMECVIDRGDTTASLGSTALTVVALAEYQRATGDTRYLALARRLAAWVLFMQRPDGSFAHVYDVRSGKRDEKPQLFYFSGESALALARMHTITGEARYAEAAGRALDWLVGWYDFFVGGFFYGEEHWTCIASEAAWPAVKREKYREFCDGYGAFLRSQQPAPGDHPDEDDLAGAYTVTPFVMPYNTPAGSRTEAMISSYLLGVHMGAPDERIRQQVLAAVRYTLRQQLRPESVWNQVRSDTVGGVPGSPTDRTVRIDYVQHVCSAMLRAADLLDPPPPAAATR